MTTDVLTNAWIVNHAKSLVTHIRFISQQSYENVYMRAYTYHNDLLRINLHEQIIRRDGTIRLTERKNTVFLHAFL